MFPRLASSPPVGALLLGLLSSCGEPALHDAPLHHPSPETVTLPPPPAPDPLAGGPEGGPDPSPPREGAAGDSTGNHPAALGPDRVDPALSRTGRVLSGLSLERPLGGRAQAVAEAHARKLEAPVAQFEERVGKKMLDWSASTLDQRPGETVFYPFSGPDFVTVHRLYPQAGRYVLVALQAGGPPPPDLSSMPPGALDETLKAYRRIVETFARRGFFVTAHMGRGFKTPEAVAPGVTGLLVAFAELEGFEVQAAEPVRIGASGDDLERSPGPEGEAGTWRSVRLWLKRRADGAAVELDYLMLDLGDPSLSADRAAERFLGRVSQGPVVFKAASHLPQQAGFSRIRQMVLGPSRQIVQDETGLAYKLLREQYDVRLFGDFRAVNPLFDGRPQHALAAAYKDKARVEPLPFPVGYRKAAGSALIVATRK